MRVERRRDHGGLGPKSEREREVRSHRIEGPITHDREREREIRWLSTEDPITQDHTGTRPLQHREREQENDTDRHNQRVCTYERKRITEKDITTHGGHGIDNNENEQGGEQMPIPVCLDVQKQENRPEVLQVALGAFLETARSSSKTCTGSDGAEAETVRERSSESVRQHFVLSTRDPFVFFALPFYSS